MTDLQIEYRKKLQDPRWGVRRLEILTRDSFCCRTCQSKNSLEVHHRLYMWGQDPWDYPEIDLITLCRKCHQKQEVMDRKEKDFILSLQLCGMNQYQMEMLTHALRNGEVSITSLIDVVMHCLVRKELMEQIIDTHEQWLEGRKEEKSSWPVMDQLMIL